MNNQNEVKNIIELLKQNKSTDSKVSDSFFHRYPVKTLDVRTPVTRKLANEYYAEHSELRDVNVTLGLVEELLASGYTTTRTFAMQLLSKQYKNLRKEHFELFEKWVDKYVKDWATNDDFSTHYMVHLLKEYPELIDKIVKWTKSKNFWKRRFCATSFVPLGRKGIYLEPILKIASELAYDKEDMVQKGTGWMLKDASVSFKEEVIEFLKDYKDAPRTFLRCALERYEKEEKNIILK